METAPLPENQAETQTAPAAITLTPEQLTALGLTVETATSESFAAALDALIGKAVGADDLAAKFAAASERLAGLEGEELKRAAAALETELADYDLDEETRGVVKALSPEQRKPLLGKLPKKAAPVEEKKEPGEAVPPPEVIHKPGEAATAKADPEEADKLIKAVQGEGKFKSYTEAREEARRRKPSLFS